MASPNITTTTTLELRLIANQTIRVQREDIVLEGSRDAAVLVLVTTNGRQILSEEIVAVTTDARSFIRLMSYAKSDGAITLHRDLG